MSNGWVADLTMTCRIREAPPRAVIENILGGASGLEALREIRCSVAYTLTARLPIRRFQKFERCKERLLPRFFTKLACERLTCAVHCAKKGHKAY